MNLESGKFGRRNASAFQADAAAKCILSTKAHPSLLPTPDRNSCRFQSFVTHSKQARRHSADRNKTGTLHIYKSASPQPPMLQLLPFSSKKLRDLQVKLSPAESPCGNLLSRERHTP
jgi:hypothetical protein